MKEDRIIEVAHELGMKPSEVVDVEDSPAGQIVTTFDGVRMINVPDDTPDGAGQTGWMLLVAPTDGYVGAPVYVLPAEAAPDGAPEESEGADVVEVPSGTIPEVLEWVGDDLVRAQAALDVENAEKEPRSTLVAELEKLLEGDAS